MLSHFSHVQLVTTPWTIALTMGFSRQEHWSELPYLPPGDLPNPGIKTRFPTLKVDSLPSEPPGKPEVTNRFTGLDLTERVPEEL